MDISVNVPVFEDGVEMRGDIYIAWGERGAAAEVLIGGIETGKRKRDRLPNFFTLSGMIKTEIASSI